MLAALERQLHVLGGLNLLHGTRDIKSLSIVRGIGLVSLGLHIALNEEAIIVEVTRVAGDAIVVAHVLSTQTLLASHERLVKLLAMAGTDDLSAHVPKDLLNGLGKITDGGCGRLLHKKVAGIRILKCELNKVNGLVEIHEEAGHVGIGHRQRLALADTVDKQRDDGTTGAHDVAVARAADGRAASAVARISVDDRLHHGLGLAHSIDGVRSLIGREADDLLHALGDSGMQHVISAYNVGADGLHGEELARGNLFESSGVENVVHTVHRIANRLSVTHVTDEESNLGSELGAALLQAMTHVILLLLVTGKDANLFELGVNEVLKHGIAKAARTARDHEGLTSE